MNLFTAEEKATLTKELLHPDTCQQTLQRVLERWLAEFDTERQGYLALCDEIKARYGMPVSLWGLRKWALGKTDSAKLSTAAAVWQILMK